MIDSSPGKLKHTHILTIVLLPLPPFWARPYIPTTPQSTDLWAKSIPVRTAGNLHLGPANKWAEEGGCGLRSFEITPESKAFNKCVCVCVCVSALQAEQSIPKVMALVLYHSCGARDNQCYHSLRSTSHITEITRGFMVSIKQVFDCFLVKEEILIS